MRIHANPKRLQSVPAGPPPSGSTVRGLPAATCPGAAIETEAEGVAEGVTPCDSVALGGRGADWDGAALGDVLEEAVAALAALNPAAVVTSGTHRGNGYRSAAPPLMLPLKAPAV